MILETIKSRKRGLNSEENTTWGRDCVESQMAEYDWCYSWMQSNPRNVLNIWRNTTKSPFRPSRCPRTLRWSYPYVIYTDSLSLYTDTAEILECSSVAGDESIIQNNFSRAKISLSSRNKERCSNGLNGAQERQHM